MIILRPADFPSNIQFQNHFSEFLAFGYKSSIGTIDVRSPARDGSRQITPGSVGVSDGQTKLLIMAAIILFLEELELTWEDVKKDASLTAALATFTSLRCCYTEFANPSHHFLHSLRDSERKYQHVDMFDVSLVFLGHVYKRKKLASFPMD